MSDAEEKLKGLSARYAMLKGERQTILDELSETKSQLKHIMHRYVMLGQYRDELIANNKKIGQAKTYSP